MGITISILFNMHMRMSADLIGNLDLIWDTDCPGDLALALYWLLVALPVLLVVALRPSGVSRLSLTLTIPIPSMAMSNYLGVMANNSRTVVHLLRCFLAVCGDNVLALLNISCVYNNIVLLMTSLFVFDIVLCVAVLLLVSVGKVSTPRGTLSNRGKNKDSGNSQHVHEIFPSVLEQ